VQNAVLKIWQAPNSVPSAEKNINFLIDHQCPQCGAPAELSETDRLFQCAFCKVNSYLMEQGYFRYLLPHHAPGGQELVYVPYWRFKGMVFSCLPAGIQNRFLDVSQQAMPSPLFPASVGLRSQAMKLRFVSPEVDGWFINPTLPFREVMDTFLTRFNRDTTGPILHQSHIGESVSLIYAPFYVGSRVVDAVLNQPVSDPLDETFELSRFPGGPADWRIRFIPTLCPNCGWDMQGRRDALVLYCKNCESLWQASKQGMTRVNVAHLPGAEEKSTLYLPFWRIKADVSGIDLNTYADLVKAANLPKVAQPGWDRIPCHFWGPAFKVRPRSFLRLIHHVTLAQPRNQLVASIPKGDMHPVNLPVSEAVETLKLNLAGIIRPQKVVQERLAGIQIKPRRYLLVYLPFEIRHHDLVQTTYHIAVNRNQLALAGNL
jgi:ribosomal protein L37AE/L43A